VQQEAVTHSQDEPGGHAAGQACAEGKQDRRRTVGGAATVGHERLLELRTILEAGWKGVKGEAGMARTISPGSAVSVISEDFQSPPVSSAFATAPVPWTGAGRRRDLLGDGVAEGEFLCLPADVHPDEGDALPAGAVI
jgi:hypothetical protein